MTYDFPIGGRDALVDKDGTVIVHPTGVTDVVKLRVLTTSEVNPVRDKFVKDISDSCDEPLTPDKFLEIVNDNENVNTAIIDAISALRSLMFDQVDEEKRLAYEQLVTDNQRDEINTCLLYTSPSPRD